MVPNVVLPQSNKALIAIQCGVFITALPVWQKAACAIRPPYTSESLLPVTYTYSDYLIKYCNYTSVTISSLILLPHKVKHQQCDGISKATETEYCHNNKVAETDG